MMQYILECLAFQLAFLLIYDVFLKHETFFQWNRAYLISTYLFSLILPYVKVEAFKSTAPDYGYPAYLWASETIVIQSTNQNPGFAWSWSKGILFGGMFLAALFFTYKMLQLYRLRSKGRVIKFSDFTQIILPNSSVAFSFFKSIFMGEKVVQSEHKNIIDHELVHIRQKHTYDLLFFELMRIIGWFNPLVYVYQSRVAELHEFIADSKVAKIDRSAQYEILLSQVFQTQNISFINQFFNSSLIKKRIVMLTKKKSKSIFKLKYLALLPLIIGMLFYTSCEQDQFSSESWQDTITVGDIENLTAGEEKEVFSKLFKYAGQDVDWSLTLSDNQSRVEFAKPASEGSTISGPNGVPLKAQMTITSKVLKEDFNLFDAKLKSVLLQGDGDMVPFAVVEVVPIFPGCENVANPRACFQQMMQKHIGKHFRYPEKAYKEGIEGRVAIMFTINKYGAVVNIKQRGPSKILEDETKRIIEQLPLFTPGMMDGKPVNVPFSIPVNFKLQQSSSDMSSSAAPNKLRFGSNQEDALITINGQRKFKS